MDVAVVADFDGTVTERAVSIMLLERFAPPDWKELDRNYYYKGELTAREVIRRQFEMIDASDEEIVDFVRQHAKLRPPIARMKRCSLWVFFQRLGLRLS